MIWNLLYPYDFSVGVNRTFPVLAHHNIIFSSDYELEFFQIFKEFRAPDDPTIYWPSAVK